MNFDMTYVTKIFEALGFNLGENPLYESQTETDIVCILCDGSHGNNSTCQRNG